MEKKDFSIPAIGIVDNIVITKDETWAYYIIAEHPYLFLDMQGRANFFIETINTLGELARNGNKIMDCHLLISNQEIDPEPWRKNTTNIFYAINNDSSSRRRFENYVRKQTAELENEGYYQRKIMLGIKLTNRLSVEDAIKNPLEFGFGDLFHSLYSTIKKALFFKELEISKQETDNLKQIEETIFTQLTGGIFAAKRPSSEELLLAIKRRLYPAMPTPYLETDYQNRLGYYDIVYETGAEIEEFPRYVKITQNHSGVDFTGYRATLSFSKFPKDLAFPSAVPPFYNRDIILPFTVNARFQMIPTLKMKQKLEKKEQDLKDELNNLSNSQQRVSTAIVKKEQERHMVELDLEEDSLPWLIGSYRLTVEAQSYEQLKEFIAYIKLNYSNNDFTLRWTNGDQLTLLQEEFPGGKLKINDFSQTTNLALLGLSGFNIGIGDVGDPIPSLNGKVEKL